MAKSYTKRADGRYQKRVRLIDKNGLEYIKVVYARTLGDLEEKVRKTINDNEQGLCLNKDLTVGEYAEKWLDSILDCRSKNTYNFYALAVKHIQEKLGLIELRKLQQAQIQQEVNSFREHPRTARIFHMTINRICEYAVVNNKLIANPCQKIILPKYKAEEKRGLTQLELDAIDAADLDARERLFISLLYYCGLRRGEALALGRGDIDLKNSVLTVNRNLAFPDNKGYLKEPKTDAGRREIPIPAELNTLLRSYKYDFYLFTTQSGDLFSRSAYRKFWARIMRKLNEAAGGGSIDRIQGLTAHIFRHNYASILYKQKVDMKTAAVYLGHSVEVMLGIYAHIEKKVAPENVKDINDAFIARRA